MENFQFPTTLKGLVLLIAGVFLAVMGAGALVAGLGAVVYAILSLMMDHLLAAILAIFMVVAAVITTGVIVEGLSNGG